MKKSISVLLVVVMVLALSATAFAAEGGSPGPKPEQPPVLENKDVSGTGTTANGDTFTIVSWDAADVPALVPFKDEEQAVTDALNSKAFEDLKEKLGIDPKDLVGSSLAIIKFADGSNEKAPVPVVLFYGEGGKPLTGLYFYDGEWDTLEVKVPENGAEGEYTLVFGDDGDEEGGLKAEVTVTIENKPEV